MDGPAGHTDWGKKARHYTMRILLLSRYDRLGASSRVRMFQYIPRLEELGVEITAAPLFTDDYLRYYYRTGRKDHVQAVTSYLRRVVQLAGSRRYDLLWLEKELFPFLPAWGESLLHLLGKPYVVDYDDAVFHNYDIHLNFIVRSLLGRKIDTVMAGAAVVVAGNAYLAERARQAGARRVVCVPSVIDLERYPVAGSRGDARFAIGWVGSPTASDYLGIAARALAEVCRGENSCLVMVGAGPVALPDVPLESRTWSEETEVADIGTFDVGIMPLPDTPWERGKCGFKLIQYMACGLPVIASPVGVNKELVEHGANGFLASTQEEWVQAIKVLKANPELRREMGRAGRARVEREYCLQVTAPRILDILMEAAGR